MKTNMTQQTFKRRWNGLDALFSGNWLNKKEYKDGNDRTVNGSAIAQRGLLAKLAYNFNDSNRLTLSHRQEKTYGERNLREEFDFSQVGNDKNNSPRYRILNQDTTNLEYEGKQLGLLGSLKANIYRQTIKREEPTATSNPINKINIIGANFGFDTPLLDKHTLKYSLNWRHQLATPRKRTCQPNRSRFN